MCLFENITLGQAFSYEYWSIIWSTYSSWTPRCQSDQFRILDRLGHGVVTLPPTLLLSYAATWNIPWLSARAIGVVGIIFNYQMLYGTVLYFCNYCLNGYYVKTARRCGSGGGGKRHLDRVPARVDVGVLADDRDRLVRGAQMTKKYTATSVRAMSTTRAPRSARTHLLKLRIRADRKRMSDDRTINCPGSRCETLRIVFSNRRLRASTRANLESLS